MITRKRKRDEENISAKRINIDWDNMISPSSIRNYLLKDPMIDWCKYYNINTIYDKPNKYVQVCKTTNNEPTFVKYIMEQGNIFEENVYQLLANKYQVIKIAESYQARDIDKFHKTIECMKQGIDIIYQGVLHDYDNNLYGVPDLLIRADKIKNMFTDTQFDLLELEKKSIKLNTPYHYVVVDIKHSTLYMASNNINLLNCNSFPAYKGQLYIYNKILSSIQGIEPRYSYILGKGWTISRSNITTYGNNFMDKLGTIDYMEYDKQYNILVKEAMEWIYRMRKDGHMWSLYPKPSIPELYPNMKNDKDGYYRNIKNELNNHIKEITSIWMCGYDKRKNAHSKKIFNWNNTRCNAKILGFKPGKIYNMVNNILNINRQSKKAIYYGTLRDKNSEHIMLPKKDNNIMEFYIDFETINNNLSGNINYIKKEDTVFMIGLGWFYKTFHYKCFIIKSNTIIEEENMIKEFTQFYENIMKTYKKKDSIFYHWSPAEPTIYRKLSTRYDIKKINFFDLYKLFYDNNIVINGALTYSLKDIAKAMKKHNMIKTSWDINNYCGNGLNAMLYAMKLYESSDNITKDNDIMKNIIEYNTIDCKVLWEILTFLRK